MTPNDYPIAVVGNGQITTSTGGVRECPPHMARNVVQLAEWSLGPVQPARSIWIVPGSEFAEMAADPAFWQNDDPRWHLFTTGAAGSLPDVAAVRRDGQEAKGADRREVLIYCDTPHESGLTNRWRMPYPIDTAGLLALITTYERSLGVPTGYSPAQTALAVLEKQHMHCERAAWLDALSIKAMDEIPWPTPHALGHVNHEPPKGAYVHVFDKKSAYMASANRPVGRGNPVRWGEPPEDKQSTWRDMMRKEAFVGVWHVTATAPENADPHLPNPWYEKAHDEIEGWFYSPQIKLALLMGWQVHLIEAYVWKHTHKTLEPWVKALFKARQANKGQPVETMIKSSFTQSLGIMSHHDTSHTVQWYHRPDWQGLVTGEHYLRQVKKIMQLQEIQPGYLGCFFDAIWWVSNEPDPGMAMPLGWMGPDGMLGQYRHTDTFGGEDAQHLRELAASWKMGSGAMNREIVRMRRANLQRAA